MNNFPRYDSYKDSGVNWLDEIPAHWEVIRSKRLFQQRNERARKDDEQLTASQKFGVIFQEEFMELEGRRVTQVEFNRNILKHIEPNDFLISMRSFQGGIEFSKYKGCVSSAYVVLTPTKDIVPEFYQYLLKSDGYIRALSSTSNLVRDGQALRFENFSLVDLIVIPKEEQTAIAEFLDRKTAQIEKAIAQKERLIELLKERRQILIHKAVTRGLNPNVKLKHSGVNWIGEIPTHWEVRQLRRLFSFLNNRRIPLSGEEREKRAGIYPYYGASGIIDYVDDYIFGEPLILIAEDGANLLSKSTPLAFVATGKYWVNNHAHIIKPIYKGFTYWAELLSAVDYTVSISGAAQPKLTKDRLASIKLPVPPESEILEIVEYIEKVSAKIETAISCKQNEIQKLKEYKTVLINSAVTGKIKVCGNNQNAEMKTSYAKSNE